MSVVTSSYTHISASGLVYGSATQLYTVILSAGSANATLTLTDWNSATGGATICKITALANSTETVCFEKPVFVKTGIYATLSGTGAAASISLDGNFTTTSTSTSTTTS